MQWEVEAREIRRRWLERCADASRGAAVLVVLALVLFTGSDRFVTESGAVMRRRGAGDLTPGFVAAGYTAAALAPPLALAWLAALVWPVPRRRYRLDDQGVELRRGSREDHLRWGELEGWRREGDRLWLALRPEARAAHGRVEAVGLWVGERWAPEACDLVGARLERLPEVLLGEKRAFG